MNPSRFNRVEPGTFDRQQQCQQPGFTRLLRRPIVSPYPLPQFGTFVPACVILDDRQYLFACPPGLCQQANQKPPGVQAVGLSGAERQQHFSRILPNRSKTRQCLLPFAPFGLALHQV